MTDISSSVDYAFVREIVLKFDHFFSLKIVGEIMVWKINKKKKFWNLKH